MRTITCPDLLDEIAFLDGSLRDIYIYNESLKDWDRLIKLLKEKYPLKCVEEIIPDSVREIIPIVQERGFCLMAEIGKGIYANCHFYVSNEEQSPIEFDLDPREFRSIDGIKNVLHFMSVLGDELGLEVFLTAENTQDVILAVYSPVSEQCFYVSSTTKRILILQE